MTQKRGRKSADELAALAITGPLVERRLELPEHLTPDQEAVARAAIDALPARFFSQEQSELLAAYARHVVTARMPSAEIDRWRLQWLNEEGGLERLDRLLKMREREARAVLATARSLRITNQARTRAETAARMVDNEPTGRRPWDGAQFLKGKNNE